MNININTKKTHKTKVIECLKEYNKKVLIDKISKDPVLRAKSLLKKHGMDKAIRICKQFTHESLVIPPKSKAYWKNAFNYLKNRCEPGQGK